MGNVVNQCHELSIIAKKGKCEIPKISKSFIPSDKKEKEQKAEKKRKTKDKNMAEDEVKSVRLSEESLEIEKSSVIESKLMGSMIYVKDHYFTPQHLEYYEQRYDNLNISIPNNWTASVKPKKIRFKEGELLGYGSFGKVFLGLNMDTGELMAVKQVDIVGFSNNDDREKSLAIEIDFLSQLKHKNIVRYIGTTKTDKTFNIFLEYVAGGSINSLISKYGKFNESLIRIYTKQILEGLEYLHWNNIVHRDIKGANVLVDNNGVCKLADFGSSKKICGLLEAEKFQSLRGTANWMAPEVVKQTGHGRFADIWSVGCTIIEMATGKPPWSQYGNAVTAMFKIAKTKEPPTIPNELSPEGIDFLKKCFRINPNERNNVYELLRHQFVTGNVQMFKEVKKICTVIPEELIKNSESNQNQGEKKKLDFGLVAIDEEKEERADTLEVKKYSTGKEEFKQDLITVNSNTTATLDVGEKPRTTEATYDADLWKLNNSMSPPELSKKVDISTQFKKTFKDPGLMSKNDSVILKEPPFNRGDIHVVNLDQSSVPEGHLDLRNYKQEQEFHPNPAIKDPFEISILGLTHQRTIPINFSEIKEQNSANVSMSHDQCVSVEHSEDEKPSGNKADTGQEESLVRTEVLLSPEINQKGNNSLILNSGNHQVLGEGVECGPGLLKGSMVDKNIHSNGLTVINI